MSETVITRFAPSPTGYLHIGGARTALFNWLYAKSKGGKMLLRIEDTDQARSTEGAVLAILDGLRWLELDWDGEPVYQLSRAERHRQIAEQLLAEGKAYRCYATPEELQAMRDRARAESRAPGYDGTWRDRDHSEAPEGMTPAIRFKAPREGETGIEDEVQGRVVFANKDLHDLVLLTSDGSPTYMLSVVVDDHDMDITHVIRGDDHLTNAARQTQIFKALGWETPIFAHVPLIHGPDGAKLSKRHGALGVEAYRAMGYLPVALRNYLVRLGWAHGDDEIFSTAQMIEWFDLPDIGRSPARFDFDKLEYLNAHYIRDCDDDDKLTRSVRAILPEIEAEKRLPHSEYEENWKKFTLALPGLKERAKTLLDLIDGARFIFVERPLEMDDKALKLLDEDARLMLSRIVDVLDGVDAWDMTSIENSVRAFGDKNALKFGKVAQPLRAALTGGLPSPGIFDVLLVLGKKEAVERLRDQV